MFVPKLEKNRYTKSESFLKNNHLTDKQPFRISFFSKLADSTHKQWK